MPTTRGTLPDLYLSRLANLRGIVTDNQERYQSAMKPLFFRHGPEMVKGSTVVFTGVSGLGLFVQTSEGEEISSDQPVQGYDQTFTVLKHGLTVVYTDEMFDDDQDAIMQEMSKQLGISGPLTLEVQLANIFNNGFGTELTADGLSVFNAAHTTPKAGTFRNTPATNADLALSSLEQAYIDIGNFIDQAGRRMRAVPKHLVVPTEFAWTARRLLETPQLPFSSNNDINPALRALDIVVSEDLTDTDAWFVVMEPHPTGMVWIDKKPLTVKLQRNERSQSTDFIASYRSIQGCVDARHVYGNPGA